MGNRVRFDLTDRSFYEVWYLTVVHRQSGQAFWIRSTLLQGVSDNGQRRGGLWCARFDPRDASRNLLVQRAYPESQVRVAPNETPVAVGDSLFDDTRWQAAFVRDGWAVDWDLHWEPQEDTVWMIPDLVRRSHIPKADSNVPHIDIKLTGTLTINGETVTFDGDPAGQAHHWGYHYAKEWIWGHCNVFDHAEDSWLEFLSAKIYDAGSWTYPFTMLQVKTPEGRFGVNTPWALLRSRATYENGSWRVTAQDGERRIELHMAAPPERFVCAPYESPHHEAYWCHNSCLADLRCRVLKREGTVWRQERELISTGRAAAEFCTTQDTTPADFVFRTLAPPVFVGE